LVNPGVITCNSDTVYDNDECLNEQGVQYCVPAPTDCRSGTNNDGKKIQNFPEELEQMGRFFENAAQDADKSSRGTGQTSYVGQTYFTAVGKKCRKVLRDGLESGDDIFFKHIWETMRDLVWDMSKPKSDRLQYDKNQFWRLKQKYDNLVKRWMTEIYVEGTVEP